MSAQSLWKRDLPCHSSVALQFNRRQRNVRLRAAPRQVTCAEVFQSPMRCLLACNPRAAAHLCRFLALPSFCDAGRPDVEHQITEHCWCLSRSSPPIFLGLTAIAVGLQHIRQGFRLCILNDKFCGNLNIGRNTCELRPRQPEPICGPGWPKPAQNFWIASGGSPVPDSLSNRNKNNGIVSLIAGVNLYICSYEYNLAWTYYAVVVVS
jgi:hypothetical protein